MQDTSNLDWVPTKNIAKHDQPSVATNGVSIAVSNHAFTELVEPPMESNLTQSFEEISLTNTVDTQTENPVSSVGTQTEKSVSSVGVQKDIEGKTVSTQTENEYTGLSAKIQLSYEEQIQYLKEMLSIHHVTIENFRNQDKKTCFFTGISKYVTMEVLFQNLEQFLPKSAKLTKFQLFIITLSHLRLNLSFQYLSFQFNVNDFEVFS